MYIHVCKLILFFLTGFVGAINCQSVKQRETSSRNVYRIQIQTKLGAANSKKSSSFSNKQTKQIGELIWL